MRELECTAWTLLCIEVRFLACAMPEYFVDLKTDSMTLEKCANALHEDTKHASRIVQLPQISDMLVHEKGSQRHGLELALLAFDAHASLAADSCSPCDPACHCMALYDIVRMKRSTREHKGRDHVVMRSENNNMTAWRQGYRAERITRFSGEFPAIPSIKVGLPPERRHHRHLSPPLRHCLLPVQNFIGTTRLRVFRTLMAMLLRSPNTCCVKSQTPILRAPSRCAMQSGQVQFLRMSLLTYSSRLLR